MLPTPIIKAIDPMNEWKKFSKSMLEIATEEIMKDFDEIKYDLDEVYRNQIFDTGGPISLDRDFSKKEKYFSDLFSSFNEIHESLETLKDIPIYIQSFPYRNKRITKPRYLRYHIENYFNEIYILKERLIAYLNNIRKAFKSDKHYKRVYKVTAPLYQIVTDPLEGILNTRGVHVHKSRFRTKDLSRLDNMELLVSGGPDEISSILEGYYKCTYRKIRRKWKKQFMRNNEQIDELLSIYGNNLSKILFDSKEEKLIYPN